MGRYGKEEVLAYLDERGVTYEAVEHEAVFTMEGMEALRLPFADEVVKNLFLRDDKKRAYYLVIMPEDSPRTSKSCAGCSRRALCASPLRKIWRSCSACTRGPSRPSASSTTKKGACRW